MKRREFIRLSALTTFSGSLFSPVVLAGNPGDLLKKNRGKVKNIIFLVSDGMSIGTLTMADQLMNRKLGKMSTWMELYRENRVTRALMDTASADSLVTDSAAASSAWGGGVRVMNGSLNMNADGSANLPILQQFKAAGKSTGCVTTVPITHATPAGFCVSTKNRGSQEIIASLYLPLRFDVMMGGGFEYFSEATRSDKKDLFTEFRGQQYQVVLTRDEMEAALPGKPLLGVFHEDGLPYALDHRSDPNLTDKVPTLAEMTRKAITLMSNNDKGFVLQVEGGKVDWGAHANDAGALLYDQIAFDEALSVAIGFAEKRHDTLVIITTDHGNANPGLIKSDRVNEKFDTLLQFKHTNEWILNGIEKDQSPSQVIERILEAQGILLNEQEARSLLEDYANLKSDGLYNAYQLPFRKLAQVQQAYTSIGWSGMDHTGDYVELALFGAGQEVLPPFIRNTTLHHLMLELTGLETTVGN